MTDTETALRDTVNICCSHDTIRGGDNCDLCALREQLAALQEQQDLAWESAKLGAKVPINDLEVKLAESVAEADKIAEWNRRLKELWDEAVAQVEEMRGALEEVEGELCCLYSWIRGLQSTGEPIVPGEIDSLTEDTPKIIDSLRAALQQSPSRALARLRAEAGAEALDEAATLFDGYKRETDWRDGNSPNIWAASSLRSFAKKKRADALAAAPQTPGKGSDGF